MPQVQLNTRVDIDTYNRLKEASEKLNKSIASIVDEALNQYLKEASTVKKLIGTISTGDSRMELYAENQGNAWQIIDGEGNDTEVSGKTLAEAVRAACAAWSDNMKPAGAHHWDLELSDEAEKALTKR
jgi:predicted DNA-binding protein